MRLTWLGHAAFRLEFGAAKVLIDPFFTGNPAFRGDAEQEAEGCTHVLITHGHDDHVGDTADIAGKSGAQVVACFEVCMYLTGQGVGPDRINPGNHGGTVDCGGFTVTFVNALHSASTMKSGQPLYLGNPTGLIVRASGEKTLYHMGDTDIFGDMALIDEIYSPKTGIVPIGDRFTMGAKTAALACRRFFDFETIIPCHYASFPMVDQSADKFLAEMGEDRARVVVPQVGQTLEV